MKKIICFLLIIVSTFSFSLLFNNQKLQVNDNIERVEQNSSNSYNILLPTKIDSQNQSEVYNSIVKILQLHNANIYFSKVGPNGKAIKFIYLSNSDYFNNFEITEGRPLNLDEIDSNKFLSSENAGNENQLGNISTFDGTETFEIRTLKSMITGNYLLSGNCTIQLSDTDHIDSFLKDLENSLNVNEIQEEAVSHITPEYYNNQWIIPSIYFVIVLLILYSILKSYKKFGIQKMLGYSNKDIWIKEISYLIIRQCIIIFIVDAAMSLFLFKDFNIYYIHFLKSLFISNASQVVILFIVSSIPFIYLETITVTEIIKNKLPIKDIIIFNSVLKVILIILGFNLINQGIQNFDKIENIFNDNYKAWEDAKGYYVIPNMNIRNGDITPEEEKMLTPLYFSLNKEGALMANFTNFSPNKYQTTRPKYESDIAIVNPNYLKINSIYDVNNNPISISENNDNLVLLVPDKYKENEKNIISLWKKIKKGYGENTLVSNQEIKIIYTKSGQKIFSYETDVNPNEGNMVTDPIVRVITEKNGTNWDYDITIGCNGCPIKIKTDPSSDPEEYIYGKLKEVRLDKYVDKIAPANDGIAAESKSTFELLVFIIGGLIITIIALLIIITQNIYCFFEQYKKQLAIRQFHGYNTISKYKECFSLILATSLGAFLVNMYIKRLSINIQLPLSIIFIFIDLLLTMITIKFVSKRKIIRVIKGS